MSYHRSAHKGGQLVRQSRRSMGSWWDDLTGSVAGNITDPQDSADIAACKAQGDAASADIDARQADLIRTWQPSGFYAASDITKMLGTIQPMIDSARSMLTQATADADNDSAVSQLKNAMDELDRHTAQIATYQAAAQSAGGLPINAPGFKDFVVKTLGAASAAIDAAVTLSCLKPWFASAMEAIGRAAVAVWSAAKAIAGVLITAGATTLKVAEETLDILKYAPYAAAAVGAYILINELKRYKKRRG